MSSRLTLGMSSRAGAAPHMQGGACRGPVAQLGLAAVAVQRIHD